MCDACDSERLPQPRYGAWTVSQCHAEALGRGGMVRLMIWTVHPGCCEDFRCGVGGRRRRLEELREGGQWARTAGWENTVHFLSEWPEAQGCRP